MGNIVLSIRQKGKFVSLQGVSEKKIEEAEEKLKVKFSNDFKEYVSEFGAVSYVGHELTGICNEPALDVVQVTINEREFFEDISADWYVIEQTHIDGIVIWQTSEGGVYKVAPNTKPIKICNSLIEYICGI